MAVSPCPICNDKTTFDATLPYKRHFVVQRSSLQLLTKPLFYCATNAGHKFASVDALRVALLRAGYCHAD